MDELFVQKFEIYEEKLFRCGGCHFTTSQITDLHYHQQFHGIGGSYYFCHVSQTAYPRFKPVSSECQTDSVDFAIAEALDSPDVNTDMIIEENNCLTNGSIKGEMSQGGSNKFKRPESNEILMKFKRKRKVAGKKKGNSRNATKSKSRKLVTSPQSQHIDHDKIDTFTDDEAEETDQELATENHKETISKRLDRTSNVSTHTVHDDYRVDEKGELYSTVKQTAKFVNDNNYAQPDLHDHQYLKSSNLHQCIYCENISYKRKISLLQHFRKHHGNELPFHCELCDKRLVSMFEVKTHSQEHKKGQFKCSVCHKGFSLEINLTEHMTCHNDSKPFSCHLCPNTYKRQTGLKDHLTVHTGVKSHICEHCGKSFSNRTQILKHMKYCVKTAQCEVCKKLFADPCKVKLHMRRHTGERPYICECCGQAFGFNSGLLRHKKFVHMKQRDFKCSQCEKTFVTRQTLNRHERTHSQMKHHVCTQCGKSFREFYTLKVHTRRHTGESPYVCVSCGLRFKHNVVRKKHQLTCPANSEAI